MPDTGLSLSLRHIVKQFGGVRALDDATFEVRRGSVHGLVGQNGAGKSTLIKILAGLHKPDGGEILIDGKTEQNLTPHHVERLGIHFIHQDRLLVPSFTVGEALLLGQEITLAPRTVGRVIPLLNRRAMQRHAAEILKNYFDLTLPPGALISSLTTAQKQIVQITRALLRKPSVIVFDEPTAALVRREADILFALIRRLRDEGITIVYISHYLNEIEALCDRVTVLRNGKDVASLDKAEISAGAIASLMVERDIGDMFPKQVVPLGEPVLTVTDLRHRSAYSDIGFTVRRGEIVGITGLLGSGAKEVIRTLFGLERPQSGEIRHDGKVVAVRNTVEAVGRGTALVPEDRRGHGVALGLSVAENTTLASLSRFSKVGFLGRLAERGEVDRLIKALAIRTPSREAAVRTLSGGNQQKVVLAKWLSRQADLYILDEPTVGIDIGSKVEIYRLIGDLAARGAGILILSTDLPELVGIADRIIVMYRGEIIRDGAASATSVDGVLAAATGSWEVRHVG
ncbi:ribose import ATP-binding protein RbsA 1 [Labrys miyagiensis]